MCGFEWVNELPPCNETCVIQYWHEGSNNITKGRWVEIPKGTLLVLGDKEI